MMSLPLQPPSLPWRLRNFVGPGDAEETRIPAAMRRYRAAVKRNVLSRERLLRQAGGFVVVDGKKRNTVPVNSASQLALWGKHFLLRGFVEV